MAFVDSWTGRRGILGWRDGRTLPVADVISEFQDEERQMLLRLPGQHDFGVIDPPSGLVYSRLVQGIGIGFT